MTMLTLNVVIPDMPEEAEQVTEADNTWPTVIVVPWRFHVMVIGPLAAVGFQLEVPSERATDAVPSFLRYIVRITWPPGDICPQLIDESGIVQPESE